MPDATFFRPELFGFLRQLRRHNNREWFAKNKARYHKAVLEPALQFIGSFAPHLAKLSLFFVADPRPTRGSLFRIYRDITGQQRVDLSISDGKLILEILGS